MHIEISTTATNNLIQEAIAASNKIGNETQARFAKFAVAAMQETRRAGGSVNDLAGASFDKDAIRKWLNDKVEENHPDLIKTTSGRSGISTAITNAVKACRLIEASWPVGRSDGWETSVHGPLPDHGFMIGFAANGASKVGRVCRPVSDDDMIVDDDGDQSIDVPKGYHLAIIAPARVLEPYHKQAGVGDAVTPDTFIEVSARQVSDKYAIAFDDNVIMTAYGKRKRMEKTNSPKDKGGISSVFSKEVAEMSGDDMVLMVQAASAAACNGDFRDNIATDPNAHELVEAFQQGALQMATIDPLPLLEAATQLVKQLSHASKVPDAVADALANLAMEADLAVAENA